MEKEKSEHKKKGIQLNQAFGAVLTLVLVAVLVIIAIYLFGNLQTAFVNSESVSIINETGTINAAGYLLSNYSLCGYGSQTIDSIRSSGNVLIPATNYTVTGPVITNATGVTYTDALLSYSFTWGGEACNGAQNMVTQFTAYPALIGLVGTIIFLGIVIGVLVASFVFGGKPKA
jgi:hypothetical protein